MIGFNVNTKNRWLQPFLRRCERISCVHSVGTSKSAEQLQWKPLKSKQVAGMTQQSQKPHSMVPRKLTNFRPQKLEQTVQNEWSGIVPQKPGHSLPTETRKPIPFQYKAQWTHEYFDENQWTHSVFSQARGLTQSSLSSFAHQQGIH